MSKRLFWLIHKNTGFQSMFVRPTNRIFSSNFIRKSIENIVRPLIMDTPSHFTKGNEMFALESESFFVQTVCGKCNKYMKMFYL